MGKIVRRLILDDGWAIGRNESWFSDMSKKGLHLKKMGLATVHFEKGVSADIAYRMDIANEGISAMLRAEKMEVYKEAGWEFVCQYNKFYVFSRATREEELELHTDPIEQGYTLEILNRQLKRNALFISICTALILILMCAIWFMGGTPFLSSVSVAFFSQLFLLLMELYLAIRGIGNYVSMKKLIKKLEDGVPVNHKEKWRWRRTLQGILFFLSLGIGVSLIFSPILAKGKTEALPQGETNLAILRLDVLEKNENLQRTGYRVKLGELEAVDFENMVEYQGYNPLAPVAYKVCESGIAPIEKWADGSGAYTPSIRTQYYALLLPQMAQGLMKDLMKKYVETKDPFLIGPKSLSVAGFDQLYYTQRDEGKQLFAIVGNQVVYVRYHGNKEVGDVVPLLLKSLK